MADTSTIRTAFQRNGKAVALRPSSGQRTGTTKVRLTDGTTCEIESGEWTFRADVGEASGGNNAGPGPSVLARAALGSCLAIGYSTWAAHLGVPITRIEVDVESDSDYRGMYGVADVPPGFAAIRCCVRIESPAPESDVRDVIERADAHSPVLDDFARAIPVERDVHITTPGEESP
jgi:uncharacterized OsmC-like protein